jgi:signal transduction histidine kinase
VAVETVTPRGEETPHTSLEPRSIAPEPGGRRAGLRVQLVVALGVLAVVGFVPLYLAVASLTTHTLRQNREDAARALGRAVAGRLAADIAAGTSDDRLRDVATVSLDLARDDEGGAGGEGVVAIRIARPPPALAIEVGHPATLAALRALPAHDSGEHVLRANVDGFGPIVAVDVATSNAMSGANGAGPSDVQVALRVGDQASRAAPLLSLVAFYTASFAVVMIVIAYLLLTRVMVRPIRRVVQATRDVDAGVSRRIDPRVGRGGAEEVAELGRAIARTTARLVDREEALAAKVRQLESARADLLAARDAIVRSERLASVGRLAAGLAHEVGNPIAALLGLEEVVLGGELDEETRDLVARMKRETERVHSVLRDLLDFARAEQDPTSRETTDATSSIADVVEEVSALVKPQKSMRDIELEIAIEDDLPPVRIAAARLQQILLNLILNAGDAIHAARAEPDAEGTLGRITIHATRSDDPAFVHLEVSDDGPGVPTKVRDVLFEPFVTTKEVGKGTGLGLAVCRGLVEGIGGSIRLSDTPPGEHGAWFVVELPTPSAPPPKRSVAPPPPSSG